MKSLLLIITLSICLLTTPSLAWEKFDGQLTDIAITERQRDVIEYEVSPNGTWEVTQITQVDDTEPSTSALEDLRIEMGLEATAEYVESIPGIHVYDSFDDYVGLLVSTSVYTIVAFNPSIESMIKIDARTGAISSGKLCFESYDCTGKPLIQAGAIQYQVIKVCDTLYTGKRTVPQFRTINSTMTINNNSCSCEETQLENYFVKAIPVSARTIGLFLPIGLPLNFQAYSMPTP